MAKEVQQKKQEKKKPAKTLMEKRAQKQAKKAGDYRDESCRPDSLGIRFSGSFGASGHGFRGHYYFRRHKERC